MKKLFSMLTLVFLLVFFIGLSNVLADECTDNWKKTGRCTGYSCSTNEEGVCVNNDSRNNSGNDDACTYENDLEITFKEDGSVILNDKFNPGISYDTFVVERINDPIIYTDGLKHQIKSLYTSCPSSIYYCIEEAVGVTIGDIDVAKKLPELFKKEDKKEFFSAFVTMIASQSKETYIYYASAKAELEDEIPYIKRDNLLWNLPIAGTDYYMGGNKIEQLFNLINGETDFEQSELFGSYDAKIAQCGYLRYTGDKPTYNLSCTNSTEYFLEYQDAIDGYLSDNCKDSYCKAKLLNKLKLIEERTQKFCSNILENYNYDGDVEQGCIEQCFDIAKTMNSMKENAGINKGNVGSCGFSARLLSWGRNIVKWVKYIIPVILIILGILDFIRAITKDKEEEMKKAQDRFVKRLIAAALIFIIPFILGFVLDKMGFGEYINGCNVIEELNNYNENEEDS